MNCPLTVSISFDGITHESRDRDNPFRRNEKREISAHDILTHQRSILLWVLCDHILNPSTCVPILFNKTTILPYNFPPVPRLWFGSTDLNSTHSCPIEQYVWISSLNSKLTPNQILILLEFEIKILNSLPSEYYFIFSQSEIWKKLFLKYVKSQCLLLFQMPTVYPDNQ
jgi:hypothetical protein